MLSSSSFFSSFNVPRLMVILVLFDYVSPKDEVVYIVDFFVLMLIFLEILRELANVTIFLIFNLGVLLSTTAGFK